VILKFPFSNTNFDQETGTSVGNSKGIILFALIWLHVPLRGSTLNSGTLLKGQFNYIQN
jgi:hypothetical protein